MRGVGRGVVGLLAKPVAGVAGNSSRTLTLTPNPSPSPNPNPDPKARALPPGFASKLTEGLGSEAKRLAASTIDTGEGADRRFVALRVRQPRAMHDGVLRPYPRAPPPLVVPAEEHEAAAECES